MESDRSVMGKLCWIRVGTDLIRLRSEITDSADRKLLLSVEKSTKHDVYDKRIAMAGPLPPPINGQSIVMQHMVAEFQQHFAYVRVVNTAVGGATACRRPLTKLWRSVAPILSARGADGIYIAVKAGSGMWLTAATAAFARLKGVPIFLHHHSYSYVLERKRKMAFLNQIAGSKATHIVLSRSMENGLRRVMPEIGQMVVLGNAGLIDRSLLELPLKADAPGLVIGHLSNLGPDKGIDVVVDLAMALRWAGVRVRLVIGGPAVSEEALGHIDRAARELGDMFEYRGLLEGPAKLGFFNEITHFVFPSRYVHEAVPLVLYEALAAGVVCVATRRGAIAEQLEGSPSLLVQSAESLVGESLPLLSGASASNSTSRECRRAFLQALRDSQSGLEAFFELVHEVTE